MASKAFDKSQNMDIVYFLGLELFASAHSFNKCIIGWIVECLARKPY